MRLRIYQFKGSKSPYLQWWHNLKDERAKQKIQARFARIRLGNFGLMRFVGDGIQELKIDYGPGYRIYFGQDGSEVILLNGGDKSTQNEDIKKAKEYWANYKQEKICDNY